MDDDRYFLQNRLTPEQIMAERTFSAPDTIDDQYTRYALRSWWVCLQAHRDKAHKIRVDLYERALKYIPNCYKLWFNYLKESLENLRSVRSYLGNQFAEVTQLFERSLVYMHKMPNIWMLYTEFLASQNSITKTREVYDRALMSLPVTQHARIWKKYCEWVATTDAIKTACSVFERYLKVNPDYKEEFVDYLVSKSEWDRAAVMLAEILNDDGFSSSSGKSNYDFLSYLCDMISMHPTEIKSIDCAPIMFYGIKKYTDEVASLWIRLADYYIKLGLFEKARDVFEEAINSVQTSKDFSQLYTAYLKFEESLITMISEEPEESDDDMADTELAAKLDKILRIEDDGPGVNLQDEIDLKLHRLEQLLERRPLLLNSCALRQNKYNVNEWLTRVRLFKNDERMVLKTFKEALETIEPLKADMGRLSDLWIEYGRFYWKKGDRSRCNQIISQGTKVIYKSVEEYVNVWSKWAEILLDGGYHEDALAVVKQALFRRTQKKEPGQEKTAADQVPYALTLWQLYLDLEKSFGTFTTLRAAYKRMLELKVVTPFIVINFAQLLEENAYFEESFKAFEAGLSIFTWPALYDIWILYITKFIQRYRGEKVERVRNLFESVIEQAPKEKCKIFYVMYGEFEEEYGLLNHAIEIYDRMVFNVDYVDKMEAYNIYIAKVATYLGITKTRAVFESAIENLKEADVIQMGLRLAQLERKFGEIDRSRAIYMHIAQFNDPRYDDFELWKTWENFELHHGNEDTYKDLKRVSKSVISKFNLLPPDPQKIKDRVEKGQI